MHQNVLLRHPVRTYAGLTRDLRGEDFGPRYDSDMLTLVGALQYICIYITRFFLLYDTEYIHR